jgi:hypothetical protein
MASNYPPRKKDDSKSEFKRRQLRERTVAKRYLESREGIKTKDNMSTGERVGKTVHGRAVMHDSDKRFNREFKTSFYGKGRIAQEKNLKKARSEFEQEAGERRRQRAIGAKARANRQARFLATEKKPSKARAGKTKRRER